MKTLLLICNLYGALFLMAPNSSCQPEYLNNSRVSVEGKLIASNSAGIPVKLQSGTILISETTSQTDGSFKLAGPGTTGEKTLSFDRKIKSFTATTSNCILSYDSLSIVLPNEKSYFNFPQITFEP